MVSRKVVAAGAVAALAVAGLGVGAWATFGGDEEHTERGTCADRAYELTLDEDDGGLELEFELQSAGPGEVWNVVIEQGSDQILSGDRTTDEDGEIDLDNPVEPDGTQTYVVTATPEQGESCVVELRR